MRTLRILRTNKIKNALFGIFIWKFFKKNCNFVPNFRNYRNMTQIASIDTSLVLLLSDLRQVIESAKRNVAATANYELTMMYWHIGERIDRDVLNNQRAEYGKQIVAEVARQLQTEYGSKGFDVKSIRRMMQSAFL